MAKVHHFSPVRLCVILQASIQCWHCCFLDAVDGNALTWLVCLCAVQSRDIPAERCDKWRDEMRSREY